MLELKRYLQVLAMLNLAMLELSVKDKALQRQKIIRLTQKYGQHTKLTPEEIGFVLDHPFAFFIKE